MSTSSHYSALSPRVLLLSRAIDCCGYDIRGLFAEAGLEHPGLHSPVTHLTLLTVFLMMLSGAVSAGGDARPESKTIEYACDGGKTFSVAYHEYVQDDQKVSLADSEVTLRDRQTHRVYRLQRQVSASGEKYSDASGLVFFAKGDEAIVMQDDARLYGNCSIKQ